MKLINFITIMFLMLILSVGAISAADPSTNNGHSIGTNSTTDLNNNETINEQKDKNVEIDNFSNLKKICDEKEDTITLKKDFAFDSQLDKREKVPTIKRPNIVLDGDGHKIDGKGKTLVLNVKSENVTLKNIIFMNGNNGALKISQNAKNIKIINCQFINNTGKNGGAIYTKAPDGLLEDCVFDGNQAEIGGAGYFEFPTKIIKTKFINNKAVNCGVMFYGGRSYYSPKYNRNVLNTSLDCCENPIGLIENCLFDNNTANQSAIGDFFVDMIFKKCNFTNNHAEKIGLMHLMSLSTYEVIMDGCNIINNTANSCACIKSSCRLSINNTDIINNSADSDGILNLDYFERIENCNFIGNHVNVNGGALSTKYFKMIKGCNFKNNTAGECGGAIFIDDYPDELLMNDHSYEEVFIVASNFTDNIAKNGNSIYSEKKIYTYSNHFDDEKEDNGNKILLKNGAQYIEFEDEYAMDDYFFQRFLRENGYI